MDDYDWTVLICNHAFKDTYASRTDPDALFWLDQWNNKFFNIGPPDSLSTSGASPNRIFTATFNHVVLAVAPFVTYNLPGLPGSDTYRGIEIEATIKFSESTCDFEYLIYIRTRRNDGTIDPTAAVAENQFDTQIACDDMSEGITVTLPTTPDFQATFNEIKQVHEGGGTYLIKPYLTGSIIPVESCLTIEEPP